MFVIEKFINDFRAKEEAWERARDKWLEAGTEYDYRSERDYRHTHPRPSAVIKGVARSVAIVVGMAILTFLLIGFAREIKNQPPKAVKAASEYKSGDKCHEFKVGDIGTINYGDYDGAEVKLIGGCEDHTDFEMQVTKDQTLNGEGSENSEYEDVHIKKDLIIKVDSSDNFKVTGHEEKKE